MKSKPAFAENAPTILAQIVLGDHRLAMCEWSDPEESASRSRPLAGSGKYVAGELSMGGGKSTSHNKTRGIIGITLSRVDA